MKRKQDGHPSSIRSLAKTSATIIMTINAIDASRARRPLCFGIDRASRHGIHLLLTAATVITTGRT
jgi:hypothetical protein